MKARIIIIPLVALGLAGCGDLLQSITDVVVEYTDLEPKDVQCLGDKVANAALTTRDAVTVQLGKDIAASCGLNFDEVVKDAVNTAIDAALGVEGA